MKKTLSVVLSILLVLAFAITSLGLTTVAVKSIQLDAGKIAVQAGKSCTLKVTVTPNDATNKKVTFSSSNKSVASVDAKGKIKGNKAGTAVITVVSVSNKKAIAKCSVTVSDMSRKVTLKLIITNTPRPADADLVYGKLSAMATKDINAGVTVEIIPGGDVNVKYPLLFSSGDNFDIVFSAKWLSWQTYALKGAFKAIPMSMVQQYAPNVYKNTPKTCWSATALGGNYYIIPQPVLEYQKQVFAIRGDLRTKYKLPELKTYSDLITFMDTIAKNETITPFALNKDSIFRTTYFQSDPKNMWANGGVIINNKNIGINSGAWDTKGNIKVSFIIDQPWFKKYIDTMNEWKTKGYWSADALVQKDLDYQMYEVGKSAVAYWTLDQMSNMASRLTISHPEWKTEIVDIEKDVPHQPNNPDCNGLCLNARTKNAERALMLIDLLKYNKKYFDLTWYGIEGVHYKAVGDTEYEPLTASTRFPPGSVNPWGWRTELERTDVSRVATAKTILAGWKAEKLEYPYTFGFTFLDSKVTNEKAAVLNLGKTYLVPMAKGFMSYDEGYSKYSAEAKKAGIDKLMDEYKAQIADWEKTH